MVKLCRIFLALTIAAVCLGCVSAVNADDEGDVYMISGEITSMDWVGHTIVVKWLQSYPTINYDEIVLKVPSDLKIMKGPDVIDFCDVNQFDRITVQYRRPSIGLPVVTSLIINNQV